MDRKNSTQPARQNESAPVRDGSRRVLLSVIIPIYNEKKNIPILYQELCATLDPLGINLEILFVNDGSTDGSKEALEKLAAQDPRVKVIEFRRNYGQTAALSAGFTYCRGERVVTLDGDLQNDPADIPALLEKMDQGYDLVNGWRKDRQDAFFTRRLPSLAANKLINKLIEGTRVQLKDYGCTLKAYRRDIVKGLRLYGEMHRFIPVFAAWLGGRIVEVPVNHRPRVHGSTKYSLSRVSTVLLDLLVVRFFSDYMTRPIQFFGKIARALFLLGLLLTITLVGASLALGFDLDWNTVFLLLILLGVSCFQVIIMGLIGEMQIRSYFEGQQKNHYIINRIINS